MQRRKRASKSKGSSGIQNTQADATPGNNQGAAGAENVAANMETQMISEADTPTVASGGTPRHEARPEETGRALADEDEGLDANGDFDGDMETEGGERCSVDTRQRG